jgi:hypothetical protein
VVDVTVGPGDAVSRLLQVFAMDVGVKDVRWTGKSNDDIRLVLTRMYNAELVKDSLWDGMMTLAQMKEWLALPESIQAQVFAIILRARALIELGSKAQS